jgi:putative heme transporter
VAIVAVVFALALPSIARYGAVWKQLHSLTPLWIGALAAAVLANTVTTALPWRVMLPELGFVSALRITQASTALITVLPGGAPTGMALSFAMLRTRQIGREAAGLTVALTGIWSQLSTFLFPIVALAAISAGGNLPRPVVAAAAAGIVLIVIAVALLALALAGRRRALILGAVFRAAAALLLRVARRPPPVCSRASILRVRRNTLRAMREHGATLTLATLANQLTGFLVLDLSLRALGITTAEISVAESFTAWSLARLIESLPLTPGGLGLVELGLTGTLIAFGAPHAPLLASVLLYRGLVVLPTLALGATAGLTWKLRWSG